MRTARIITVMLLLLSLPQLGWAAPQGQQSGGTTPGFKMYSASFDAGYDTGIVTTSGSIEDYVLILVPFAVAYANPTPRGSFEFIYEPEVEIYQTETELNAWNQAAGLAYSYQLSRTLDVNTGGTFLYTHDRSRQSSSLSLAPRSLYIEGRAYLNFDYRFSRATRLRFGADNWLNRSEVPETTSASGEIDEWRNSFSVSMLRSIGSSQEISLAFTYFDANILNRADIPDPLFEDFGAQQTLDAGYSINWNSGWRISTSGGVIRLPSAISGDEYTYSFSGQIGKAWRAISVGGSYLRSLSGLLRLNDSENGDPIRDPLLNNGIAESFSFSIAGEVARRMTINQQVSLSRTDVAGAVDEIETLYGALTLGVVLTDRIVPHVRVLYWEQTSPDPTFSYTRTRITAGMRFYWDRPLVTRTRSQNEGVRSILPTRGGG